MDTTADLRKEALRCAQLRQELEQDVEARVNYTKSNGQKPSELAAKTLYEIQEMRQRVKRKRDEMEKEAALVVENKQAEAKAQDANMSADMGTENKERLENKEDGRDTETLSTNDSKQPKPKKFKSEVNHNQDKQPDETRETPNGEDEAHSTLNGSPWRRDSLGTELDKTNSDKSPRRSPVRDQDRYSPIREKTARSRSRSPMRTKSVEKSPSRRNKSPKSRSPRRFGSLSRRKSEKSKRQGKKRSRKDKDRKKKTQRDSDDSSSDDSGDSDKNKEVTSQDTSSDSDCSDEENSKTLKMDRKISRMKRNGAQIKAQVTKVKDDLNSKVDTVQENLSSAMTILHSQVLPQVIETNAQLAALVSAHNLISESTNIAKATNAQLEALVAAQGKSTSANMDATCTSTTLSAASGETDAKSAARIVDLETQVLAITQRLNKSQLERNEYKQKFININLELFKMRKKIDEYKAAHIISKTEEARLRRELQGRAAPETPASSASRGKRGRGRGRGARGGRGGRSRGRGRSTVANKGDTLVKPQRAKTRGRSRTKIDKSAVDELKLSTQETDMVFETNTKTFTMSDRTRRYSQRSLSKLRSKSRSRSVSRHTQRREPKTTHGDADKTDDILGDDSTVVQPDAKTLDASLDMDTSPDTTDVAIVIRDATDAGREEEKKTEKEDAANEGLVDIISGNSSSDSDVEEKGDETIQNRTSTKTGKDEKTEFEPESQLPMQSNDGDDSTSEKQDEAKDLVDEERSSSQTKDDDEKDNTETMSRVRKDTTKDTPLPSLNERIRIVVHPNHVNKRGKRKPATVITDDDVIIDTTLDSKDKFQYNKLSSLYAHGNIPFPSCVINSPNLGYSNTVDGLLMALRVFLHGNMLVNLSFLVLFTCVL